MKLFNRAALPAVALFCALTACGSGGSGGGGPESAGPTGTSQDDALAQYAQCMRDNGMQLPDPRPDDPGSMYEGVDKDSPAFHTANKVCGSILQGIVEDRKRQNGEDVEDQQDELLVLAKCLREQGVDVRDPIAGADKPFGDSLDRTNPAVAEAIRKCSDTAPSGRG